MRLSRLLNWAAWSGACAFCLGQFPISVRAASYQETVLGLSGLQAYYRLNEPSANLGDPVVNTAAPGVLEGTWGYNAGNNADKGQSLPTAGQAGPNAGAGFRGLEEGNLSALFGGNEIQQIADQIDLGAPAQLDSEFATVAFFMKTSVLGNDSRLFTTAPNAQHTFRLIYGTNPDYGAIAVVTDGDHATPDASRLTSGFNFTDGLWHHIVVVRDGDNALNSRFYVDGQDISDGYRPTVTGFGASDSSARIGARFGQNATDWGGFEGGLDEFSYWNRALTSSEVATLFNAAYGGLFGDLTEDGSVDAADAGLLFENWGVSQGAGDLNRDGIIDAADAGLVFGAWTGDTLPNTPGSALAAVPEPASFGCVASLIGLASLTLRKKK